ncbi:MAG TPA: DUF1569 domain-containing protein [Puia sp.]|jgi:hypothetical protein|nr:DUF1569 domain-containing protein [Puia sp.]
MKTIFDKTTRDELITRINRLSENSKSQWGKMNMYQMLKHCTLWDEWVLGKNKPSYKQAFIGRLFGQFALKNMIKDERPLNQNVPTLSELKVKENNGNVAIEKNKWISLIEEYENFSNPTFIHSFFGKMTKEQIGYIAYKHTDHHLRQFNG